MLSRELSFLHHVGCCLKEFRSRKNMVATFENSHTNNKLMIGEISFVTIENVLFQNVLIYFESKLKQNSICKDRSNFQPELGKCLTGCQENFLNSFESNKDLFLITVLPLCWAQTSEKEKKIYNLRDSAWCITKLLKLASNQMYAEELSFGLLSRTQDGDIAR